MSQERPAGRTRRTGVATGLSVVGIIILAILAWNSASFQNLELSDGAPTLAIATAQADVALPTHPASDGSATEKPPAPVRYSDLPAVAYQDLPPEAHDTIALIDQGGPFPYSKDGSTFQNREGLLPDRPPPYYQEYTVVTPGESDRGARRIVAGDDGDLYYTADHYASFHEVIR